MKLPAVVPVLLRGTAAGFTGTTAMTLALWAEKRIRHGTDKLIDYDASPHVVTAASAVLHWTPSTPGQERALFLLVHWGYGSFVGVGREATGRLPVSPPVATALFLAGCQAMAFTLFPTLGGTPPPWRWQASVLASSVTVHAIYAATVAATLERL